MTKERTAPQSPEDMAKGGTGSRGKGSNGTGPIYVREHSGISDAGGYAEQIMTQDSRYSQYGRTTGTAGSDTESSRNRYGNGSGSRTAKHGICQQMMQGFYDMENLNEEWTISKAGDGKLDAVSFVCWLSVRLCWCIMTKM